VFNAAESNLMNINDIYVSTIKPKIVQGANITTLDDKDRQTIAWELKLMAQAVVDHMNSDFAERQLFGGTSAGATPYTVHDRVQIWANVSNVDVSSAVAPAPALTGAAATAPDIADYAGNYAGYVTAYDAYLTAFGSYLTTDYATYLSGLTTGQAPAAPPAPAAPAADPDGVNTSAQGAYDSFTAYGAALTAYNTALNAYVEETYGYDVESDGSFKVYDSYDRDEGFVKYDDNGQRIGGTSVVCYNGVPVNVGAFQSSFLNLTNGTYTIEYTRDGAAVDKNGNKPAPGETLPVQTIPLNLETARIKNDNSLLFPASDPIFVDIGMGIKYYTDPVTGVYTVDPQTAMDISLNGAKMLGSGLGKAGTYEGELTGFVFSNNLAQAIFDASWALEYSHDGIIVGSIDALDNASTNLLSSITKMGANQISIEFFQKKNDDYEFSLKERQNEVEGVDIYNEITYYNALEAAFQAALQLSSKVLPRSVFDFI
jgi:flagellin-like hook-associated protein FlgL